MINSVYNYLKRIKFDKQETFQLLAVILIVGFVLGLDDGRATSQLDVIWLKNFVASMLASALIFFVFVIFVKIVSYWRGYYAKYVWNPLPLLFTILLSFLTFGKLIFFLPGGFDFRIVQHRRLGKFRHGPLLIEKAMISFFSIIFVLVIAMASKSFADSSLLASNLLSFSLYFSLYAILPLPLKNPGLDILTYSVHFYIFSLLFVFITATLLYFLEPVWAVLIGVIATFVAFNKLKDRL